MKPSQTILAAGLITAVGFSLLTWQRHVRDERRAELTELYAIRARLEKDTIGRHPQDPSGTRRAAASALGDPQAEPVRSRPLSTGLILEENSAADATLPKLEMAANVGRATPSAAFQTALWAVMSGDDVALTQSFHVPPEAQEKLETMWLKLTAEQRVRLEHPERLIALVFSHYMLNSAETIGVVDQSMDTSSISHLRVKKKSASGKFDDVNYDMALGASGWQIVASPDLVNDLDRYLLRASLTLPYAPKN